MISVQMPAFNAGRYITAAIESVCLQSFRDWELIVIDDGSTDATRSIAEGFATRDARIRVIHQPNGGLVAARNRALSEMDAASAFVAFLDSDDVWEVHTLDALFRLLNANPGAVGAHGKRRYIDAEGRPMLVDGAGTAPERRRCIDGWKLRKVSDTDPTTFETLAYGNCIPVSSVLVRRTALERAGPFGPVVSNSSDPRDLARALPIEDWDMWLRLSLLGNFIYINEVMCAYRLHAANLSGNSDRKNMSMYNVRRKIHALPGLTAAQRRAISLGYRYYELYRARVAARKAIGSLTRGKYRVSFVGVGDIFRHCLQAVLSL